MPEARLSESEWELMMLCWRLGPSTAAQLFNAIDADRWVYPTLTTFLHRMVAKGFLRTQRSGRGNQNIYHPAVPFETAVDAEISAFLDGKLRNSPQALARLVAELRRRGHGGS